VDAHHRRIAKRVLGGFVLISSSIAERPSTPEAKKILQCAFPDPAPSVGPGFVGGIPNQQIDRIRLELTGNFPHGTNHISNELLAKINEVARPFGQERATEYGVAYSATRDFSGAIKKAYKNNEKGNDADIAKSFASILTRSQKYFKYQHLKPLADDVIEKLYFLAKAYPQQPLSNIIIQTANTASGAVPPTGLQITILDRLKAPATPPRGMTPTQKQLTHKIKSSIKSLLEREQKKQSTARGFSGLYQQLINPDSVYLPADEFNSLKGLISKHPNDPFSAFITTELSRITERPDPETSSMPNEAGKRLQVHYESEGRGMDGAAMRQPIEGNFSTFSSPHGPLGHSSFDTHDSSVNPSVETAFHTHPNPFFTPPMPTYSDQSNTYFNPDQDYDPTLGLNTQPNAFFAPHPPTYPDQSSEYFDPTQYYQDDNPYLRMERTACGPSESLYKDSAQ
jgi:hypothetical protein